MSIGICRVCLHAFNSSQCPRCGGAMRLDERLEPLEKTAAQNYYERREKLLADREKLRKQYGPLSREAIRFITDNTVNSLEWCGEHREAKELREALEKALDLISSIQGSRAV